MHEDVLQVQKCLKNAKIKLYRKFHEEKEIISSWPQEDLRLGYATFPITDNWCLTFVPNQIEHSFIFDTLSLSNPERTDHTNTNN